MAIVSYFAVRPVKLLYYFSCDSTKLTTKLFVCKQYVHSTAATHASQVSCLVYDIPHLAPIFTVVPHYQRKVPEGLLEIEVGGLCPSWLAIGQAPGRDHGPAVGRDVAQWGPSAGAVQWKKVVVAPPHLHLWNTPGTKQVRDPPPFPTPAGKQTGKALGSKVDGRCHV